jgi:DNA-binding transcriptional MerR regulator/methylmalonyl-CoA mutase cobalamin-binding subunit
LEILLAASASEKRHPIQVVARRTGLSADVLRAWERRYGVLDPARSGGRRRLYSDEDIDYLRLLKRATAAGRNVGQLAGLGRAALETMVREDEAAAASRPAGTVGGPEGAEQVLEQALAAILALDGPALDAVLRRAMIEADAPRFLDAVVAPLLVRIGEQWRDGEATPAHEHLASAVLRAVLSDFTRAFVPRADAPRLLSASPQGERHEFGAMLAAAAAAAAGWRVTYLGGDLPAAAIAAAARQTDAAVVALSLVHLENEADMSHVLGALRAALPPDVVLLVGGAAAKGHARALKDVDALVVSDLGALRTMLVSLAAEPRATA